MLRFNSLSSSIREDLSTRLPGQRKTQRDKLSVLVSTMLEVRSGRLMDLAHGLPLKTEDSLSRFQWIKRFVMNPLVDVDEVMGSYSREVLERVHKSGEQVRLIVDQSTATGLHRHELVMIALQVGKRAIPLCWRVYKASGSLGWKEQHEVLQAALPLLPPGCVPLLLGDRFYGNCDVISWCQEQGWDYCLRLKGSLRLAYDKDTPLNQSIKLIDLYHANKHQLEGIYLTHRRFETNIQMIKDKKHKEPWIIASSAPPSIQAARQYAKRWGIEAMFSDFKSRGFGLYDSQLRIAERIDRLIMIMAIALYWAVSTGMWQNKKQEAKKNQQNSPSIVECFFLCSKKASG